MQINRFAVSMSRLGHRAQAWYRLPHDTPLRKSHQTPLRTFWQRSDELAQERRCILDKKPLNPVDLNKLDERSTKTNGSLIDCLCPRLSWVAQPAKVVVTQSLLQPSCAAYAIVGCFPTYYMVFHIEEVRYRLSS